MFTPTDPPFRTVEVSPIEGELIRLRLLVLELQDVIRKQELRIMELEGRQRYADVGAA